MSLFTGFVLYLIIFWVTLFAVLPWGNRPHGETRHGTAGSAPENPRIGRKFLVTAGISAVLWGIVFALIQMDVLDFYDLAAQMAAEDGKN